MLSLIERYGYLIVFLGVMMEGVGLPLPGETVLITAGALARRGSLTLWEAMVMGTLGAIMGGQAGYCVGRIGGRPFVRRWGRYAFVTPERMGRAEKFFERHGESSPSKVSSAGWSEPRRRLRSATSCGPASVRSSTGSAGSRSSL
jgi:membrane protein DedA with SNARE-associated domain